MLVDTQWAFSSLVRSADWMDDHTKVATLEKAAAVKHFVGFPEWLLDKDELERYYEGVSKRCTRVQVHTCLCICVTLLIPTKYKSKKKKKKKKRKTGALIARAK
jgi:hypothetical protein